MASWCLRCSVNKKSGVSIDSPCLKGCPLSSVLFRTIKETGVNYFFLFLLRNVVATTTELFTSTTELFTSITIAKPINVFLFLWAISEYT